MVKDAWTGAAKITGGMDLPGDQQGRSGVGDGMSAKVLWDVVRKAAARAGIEKLAPHDLRRTCARLCTWQAVNSTRSSSCLATSPSRHFVGAAGGVGGAHVLSKPVRAGSLPLSRFAARLRAAGRVGRRQVLHEGPGADSRMKLVLTAVSVAALMTTPVAAQWLNHPTPGIPRTVDGKPDLTATAPRTSDGKPDFAGVWTSPVRSPRPDPLDVHPWAKEVAQRRSEDFFKARPNFQCLPSGPETFGQSTGGGVWKRILQTPGLIAILNDDLTYRQIFMDGRTLEAAPPELDGIFSWSLGRQHACRGWRRFQRTDLAEQSRTAAYRSAPHERTLPAPGLWPPADRRNFHGPLPPTRSR